MGARCNRWASPLRPPKGRFGPEPLPRPADPLPRRPGRRPGPALDDPPSIAPPGPAELRHQRTRDRGIVQSPEFLLQRRESLDEALDRPFWKARRKELGRIPQPLAVFPQLVQRRDRQPGHATPALPDPLHPP